MTKQPIRVELTADDYISASGLHSRRQHTTMLIFAGVIVLALAVTWFSAVNKDKVIFSVAAGGGGAVFLVLVAHYSLMPRRLRGIYDQQKSMQRPRMVSWNSAEFVTESSEFSSRTPWIDFLRWRENKRLFLLYASDVMFQVVPKRAFANDDDISAFRQLIQQKIAPKAGMKRKTGPAEVFS